MIAYITYVKAHFLLKKCKFLPDMIGFKDVGHKGESLIDFWTELEFGLNMGVLFTGGIIPGSS